MSVTPFTDTTQYLTFRLADDIIAISVTNVLEVIVPTTITKVPQTPEFMRGVINLRGSVVPVIDMRIRFGIERAEQTVDTCIIVVEITQDGDSIVLGALVDVVQEVVEINPRLIEPVPHMVTHLNTNFIGGLSTDEGKYIMILNLDHTFSGQAVTAQHSHTDQS